MSTQLRGIVHYELLQLWRERAWLIVTVVICFIMFLITSSISDSTLWRDSHTSFENASPESRLAMTDQITTLSLSGLVMVGLVLMIFSMLLFPVLFGDVIAKDKRYNVRELWRSLPLGEGRYLAGKTIAAMLIVLFALILCCTIIWIMWARFVFPIPIPTFIITFLLPVIPVAVSNTGIILLLTATQPTRRRAILVAVILSFGTLIFLAAGTRGSVNFSDYLNIGRPVMLRFYYTNFYDLGRLYGNDVPERYPILEYVSASQVLIAGLISFVEVGVVWALMRSFKVWQEQR